MHDFCNLQWWGTIDIDIGGRVYSFATVHWTLSVIILSEETWTHTTSSALLSLPDPSSWFWCFFYKPASLSDQICGLPANQFHISVSVNQATVASVVPSGSWVAIIRLSAAVHLRWRSPISCWSSGFLICNSNKFWVHRQNIPYSRFVNDMVYYCCVPQIH